MAEMTSTAKALNQQSVLLWEIVSPLILLLGTIGNIMNLLVMTQKSVRRTSFGCYIIGISITDLIFIWTGLTRKLIVTFTKIDIRDLHESICWIHRLLVYGSADTSVWLLTAVTLERTLSIYSPTRRMRFKGLTQTKIIIAFIAFVQYGWNFQTFFSRGREYGEDGTLITHCGYPNELSRKYYKNNIHNYIVLVDYTLLPFTIMFIMNVAIFIKLRKRDIRYTDCATRNNKGKTTGDSHGVTRSNVSHKTLMLLPVTIFFLITTLPAIAFTGVKNAKYKGKVDHDTTAQLELTDAIVTLLMFLNHSMNFFLYCLTGATFRRRCWERIAQCCCFTKHNTSIWSTGVPGPSVSLGAQSSNIPHTNSSDVTPPRSRLNSTNNSFEITGIHQTDHHLQGCRLLKAISNERLNISSSL